MRCVFCGREHFLQTHHISYQPEVVVRTCKWCHQAIHRVKDTGPVIAETIPVEVPEKMYDIDDEVEVLETKNVKIDSRNRIVLPSDWNNITQPSRHEQAEVQLLASKNRNFFMRAILEG